ncbi:MAG: BrnT family toxin [Chloroflexi bacterium]|nr:BrnT family toxin [Chloroflexota bacterium]MYE39325.1 BrnT family toxin [Chloroflexota bacterium]
MKYDWDVSKNRINLEKHQIDFSEVVNFEWDEAIVRRSDRSQEQRWRAIGYLGKRLHVVVFTDRGDVRRIISLRKAGNKERREYAQA